MIVKSIEYNEHEGQQREWCLKLCEFSNINLIVGVNSSGKTRLLNIIKGISNIFIGSGIIKYNSGKYIIVYKKRNKEYTYSIEYENNKILYERLECDDKILIERKKNGRGNILYEEQNKLIDFSIEKNQIAANKKRDMLQHPFLEDLYNWGKSVRLYSFGSDLGKNSYSNDSVRIPKINPRDTRQVVDIFKNAIKKHPNKFKKIIIKDLENIGYKITDIGVGTISSFSLEDEPIKVCGLWVKEVGLKSKTTQNNMSQGMFRAISLLIQINAIALSKETGCILIDDIGEGIDYDRSSKLVKLILDKLKNTDSQLFMTTNDRFIMNTVDLKHWNIIDRDKSNVKIYNYCNSKELFDNFAFTGLNNFDFLTTKYWLNRNNE